MQNEWEGDAYAAGIVVTLAWLLVDPSSVYGGHGLAHRIVGAATGAMLWPCFWAVYAAKGLLGMI